VIGLYGLLDPTTNSLSHPGTQHPKKIVGYSLRVELWAHKTSLTPPLLIDVSVYTVSIEESERSCTRVLCVSNSLCFYDFSIRFRKCSDCVVYFIFFHFIFLFLAISTTDGTCTMCNLFVKNACG
jgi:hypothetical protein